MNGLGEPGAQYRPARPAVRSALACRTNLVISCWSAPQTWALTWVLAGRVSGEIDLADTGSAASVIGVAIPDLRPYVLDDDLRPVAEGESASSTSAARASAGVTCAAPS